MTKEWNPAAGSSAAEETLSRKRLFDPDATDGAGAGRDKEREFEDGEIDAAGSIDGRGVASDEEREIPRLVGNEGHRDWATEGPSV